MKRSLQICILLLLSFGTAQAQKQKQMVTKEPMVEITTDSGVIRIRLYKETPKHTENFLKLAREGFYDSLLFHRVIKSFMIQGGDPQSKTAAAGQMLGNGDVGYKIPAEINDTIYHKRGALAMARDNNPEKASSGCQFYLVQGKVMTEQELNSYASRAGMKLTPKQIEIYTTVGGTPWLDGGYTVFGEVVEGLDVIDKIAAVPVGQADRPLTDIRMKVKVIE